jgi:hypothetical protein
VTNHSAFEFEYPDLTKNSVGLDQVDNTSDANKPLSTATVAALADKQPLDSDLTAIAALTTTSIGRSLLAAIDAAALRTILSLGTAATQNTGAFDAAGAAAAAQAASQPLDSDLTSIAALSTTSFGRAFLILADAAAGRSYLGLGTAATTASSAYDVAGAAAAAQAASQPLDSDLTAIAALSTQSFGRSLLTQIDAAAVKTLLSLNNVNNTADAAKTFDASQVTSGVFNIARLATGTPTGSKFVRDDGTLAVPPGGGGGGASALADLTDVDTTTDAPAQDDLLAWDAVSGKWTPATPSIGVGDISGLDENTRDVIGAALVAGSGVAVTVDDPGNTITIAVSGVVADAINDGVTTVAPSQNAVFDALALLVPKSTVTTKGDLIVGTGSGAVTRVGVGATNKQPLVVDSTQTAGVKFGIGAEASSARYVSGQYLPAAVEFISTANQVLLANYIVAIPCYIPPGMAVDRIGVYCTTGGSGATIRVAVHRPTASGYVGTQIVAHAGTLSNAASGLKEATVSLVGEGWCWFVFQTGGASATVRAFTYPTYLWTRWGPPFVDVVASTVTPYANLQAARSDAAIPSDLSTGVSWILDGSAGLGIGIYRVA